MIKREIEEKFKRISKTRKVTLVTGARQVGKSTFVKNVKEENRIYVTLDKLQLRDAANSEPDLFLSNYDKPLIIDEVQYAPNLFSCIKVDVDETNEKNKYWLTGSQRFELMEGISDSLAGRIGLIEISTLSYAEKKGFKSHLFNPEKIEKRFDILPKEVFEEIFKGGYPEYVLNNDIDRDEFFNDYITTFLERDVRNLTQVGDLLKFRRFMVAIAARNGEVLNYESICEDADIDTKTCKKWVSILEASDIIYLLQPYFNSELKRSIKSPKIIFMDTGLCSYLTHYYSPEIIMDSSVSGHFLETFVISELIKNKRNNNESLNYGIYYYRDRDGKEIDLLIHFNETIYPFEIKKTANPNKQMLNNFKILENKNFKVGNGGLLCFCQDIIPLDEKNKSYPISVIF